MIVKEEQTNGRFDFDSQEAVDSELDEFTIEEKLELFEFVSNHGINLGSDGKRNWNEIREKFYGYNTKHEAKSVTSIEKLVQHFRFITQQIIQRANNPKLAKIHKQHISNQVQMVEQEADNQESKELELKKQQLINCDEELGISLERA